MVAVGRPEALVFGIGVTELFILFVVVVVILVTGVVVTVLALRPSPQAGYGPPPGPGPGPSYAPASGPPGSPGSPGVDHAAVRRWVHAYEQAWRTPGTEALDRLFTPDATYRVSPWAEPVTGLAQLRPFWEAGRETAGEEFTLTSDVVAVEGHVAVVRVEVAYAAGTTWRDLWVVLLDEDGRCRAFEEWPFAPDRPDGH